MIKQFAPCVKKYWWAALLSPVTVIIEVLLEVRIPMLMSQIVDTGITNQDLRGRGIPRTRACRDVAELFQGDRTLLLAYNAHFDLSFLYYTLVRDGDPAILRGRDKLDLLTVYRDRKPYPHRLASAIEAYGLGGQVDNSHRAIDDVRATVAVLLAMERERDDLDCYVNLFGYNARYGLEGKPISSVTYGPQGYTPGQPLYDVVAAGV